MADNQILFETIISGLANQLQKLKDLEEELQGFEDTYSEDYKIVNDRIDDLVLQIDRTIKEAISKIQFPKSITLEEIKELIPKEYDDTELKSDLGSYLDRQIQINTNRIKTDIEKTINEIPQPEIPTPEAIQYGKIQTDLQVWINDNLDLFKSEFDSTQLKKELQAYLAKKVSDIPKAKDGLNAVGIEDITRSKDDLLITLTDGTEKRIKLPKPQIQHVGGGGVSYQVATSVLIVSTDTDITLKPESQNVLVNATSDCFSSNRSYKLGITKIDDTNNVVNILPHGSETIALDLHQELLQSQEVLNFISDGTNYWLGR